MSITATALSSDLSATGLTAVVASGTGFPTVGTVANPGYLVRIDTEYMLAIAQPVAGTIKLAQRGYNGTKAMAHDTLAKVMVSSAPSDFANPAAGSMVDLPPFTPVQETLGEDRTFTSAEVAAWGNQDRVFAITKATAIACTLVAPSKAQDGLTITFVALVAVLNVITATGLLANGLTASPYTTATGAHTKIGAVLQLQAQNGLWSVVSSQGWTIS